MVNVGTQISNGNLYLGITIIFIFCGVLNFLMQTRLQKKMLIAFIRSILQLCLLGLAISYIFELSSHVIYLVILIMILIASFREYSSDRIHQVFQKYFSILLSVIPMGVFTIYIVHEDALSKAEIVIPIFGMLIGNSLNGVVLGIERFESEIKVNRELFISDLSLGLSSRYAAKKYIQVALGAAMTPILNAMSIVGIVSIPGMMTGQILAGAGPVAASKYQLLILVSIMATIFIGAVIGVLWSLKRLTRNNFTFLSKELRNE